MNATEIDLTPFCDQVSGTRYAIGNVFVKGGWRMATDTRVAVRVPTDESDGTLPGGGRFPNVNGLFADYDFSGDFGDLPPGVDVPGNVECPTCEGSGLINETECDECDGEGEVDCYHCGSEMECEKCRGEGHRGDRCPTCNGKKTISGVSGREFDGLQFRPQDLAKVASLPGVKYRLNPPRTLMQFVFDGGGQGLLMGMTKGQ